MFWQSPLKCSGLPESYRTDYIIIYFLCHPDNRCQSFYVDSCPSLPNPSCPVSTTLAFCSLPIIYISIVFSKHKLSVQPSISFKLRLLGLCSNALLGLCSMRFYVPSYLTGSHLLFVKERIPLRDPVWAVYLVKWSKTTVYWRDWSRLTQACLDNKPLGFRLWIFKVLWMFMRWVGHSWA